MTARRIFTFGRGTSSRGYDAAGGGRRGWEGSVVRRKRILGRWPGGGWSEDDDRSPAEVVLEAKGGSGVGHGLPGEGQAGAHAANPAAEGRRRGGEPRAEGGLFVGDAGTVIGDDDGAVGEHTDDGILQ